VKVNCPEIPAGLFESELFWYEQVQRSIGRRLFVGAWALVGKFTTTNKELENRCINTIRILSADAVQNANAGHPGNRGRIMVFASSIPLKRNGKIVGAVGVSGGSGEQDHTVAEAGAKAF
jgi:Haem-degrading/Transketolase, thiamine diphosphate binding domain